MDPWNPLGQSFTGTISLEATPPQPPPATGIADDSALALPLLRKAITVADLLATPNDDWRRSETRMDTALALARLGQFDEAEALGRKQLSCNGPRAHQDRRWHSNWNKFAG